MANEVKSVGGGRAEETGRAVTVVNASSGAFASPLFYTVHGESKGKYFYEQLGCPSILKPSFRDLPGCTRLSSVGIPSTPYRQLPLDKLTGRTMGKSPTTSKREKYISPIKVNAKIRHVYSHITTTSGSSTSHESSITSTHTSHTQTEDPSVIEDSEDDARKDASTSMSPPPPVLDTSGTYYEEGVMSQRLFTVPPAYAGKLEDLEKITGHIVIQRFFTKADEAFGVWLEKQLGMNSKSVGIDTSEMTFELDRNSSPVQRTSSGRILEKILEVEDDVVNSDEEVKECSKDDFIRCECFLEYFKQKDAEKEVNEKIDDLEPFEQELLDQCVEFEIFKDATAEPNNKEGVLEESFSGPVNVHEDANETELRLSKCLVESVLQEFKESEETKNDQEDVQNDATDENPAPENDATDENPPPESEANRPCIPDVIDVSLLFKDNVDSDMNESQLDSQSKVAEYLGKLEIEGEGSPVSSTSFPPHEDPEEVEEEEITRGGSSLLQSQDENRIKRSVSADSCIGTESSGDTRTTSTTTNANPTTSLNLNDSGILLDSGRMEIVEESESHSEPSQRLRSASASATTTKNDEDEVVLSVIEKKQSSSNKKEMALASSKSLDDYSRSDLSSGLKQSDEGDADQSAVDSDMDIVDLGVEGQNIEQMRHFFGDELAELEVNEDDEVEDEEQDQFDTIIENHEKEKRLRPICRKRNVATQTTRSVESSVVSSCPSSRSTTASESSFDLEFVSKSRKYISHIPSASKMPPIEQTSKGKRSLPSAGSGLNVLNMKFTMGKEFESEVSIRIPPKSPSVTSVGGGQQLSSHSQTLPVISCRTRGGHFKSDGGSGGGGDLRNLWQDVKSKMDTRVGGGEDGGADFGGLGVDRELQVRGRKMSLISTSAEAEALLGHSSLKGQEEAQGSSAGTKGHLSGSVTATSFEAGVIGSGGGITRFPNFEDERIKRSLKRLKRILDD